MKKYFTLLIFVFLSFDVFAGEKYSGWKKAETEHFNFIYENTDIFGYVNLNVYEAAMISFGHNAIDFSTPENNTFLNSNLYDKLLTEIELSLQAGRIKFGAGYSVFYSLFQKQWILGQFHLECKLNGWRR